MGCVAGVADCRKAAWRAGNRAHEQQALEDLRQALPRAEGARHAEPGDEIADGRGRSHASAGYRVGMLGTDMRFTHPCGHTDLRLHRGPCWPPLLGAQNEMAVVERHLPTVWGEGFSGERSRDCRRGRRPHGTQARPGLRLPQPRVGFPLLAREPREPWSMRACGGLAGSLRNGGEILASPMSPPARHWGGGPDDLAK